MGPLKLPHRGIVYLDAQIIIYSVEHHPNYWPYLEPMWDAAFAGDVTLVTRSLSILECLVVPERDSDVQLIWTLNKCSALHGAFLCRQFPTPHSALRPGYLQNINRLKPG